MKDLDILDNSDLDNVKEPSEEGLESEAIQA